MIMISDLVYVCGKISPERIWLVQLYFAHVKISSTKNLKKMYDTLSILDLNKFSFKSLMYIIYLHKYSDIRKVLNTISYQDQKDYRFVICFLDYPLKGFLDVIRIERFANKFNCSVYTSIDSMKYRNVYYFFSDMFKKKFKIITKSRLSDLLNLKKIKTN